MPRRPKSKSATIEAPMASAPPLDEYQVELVAIDQLTVNPHNPRATFDDAELAELAASIRSIGVLSPILARPSADNGHYEIVAGERRYRAAQLAGLSSVPVTVRQLDDQEAQRLALIENLQRVDLSPLEEAQGYARLRELGYKQTKIGELVGRGQSSVAKALALLDLPAGTRKLLDEKRLTAAHGAAVAKFREWPAIADRIAELAAERQTPARDLEHRVPFSQHLIAEKLLVPVYDHDPWSETCRNRCPYGAYRRDDYRGVCLRPEHRDELKAEHQAQEQQAARERLAAATGVERETGMPRLRDMENGTYERIDGMSPEGCTAEACPCRGQALGITDQPVSICTDVKRYRRLKAQQTRVEKQARREWLETAQRELDEKLLSCEKLSSRDLAPLVLAVLERNWYDLRDSRQQLADRYTEVDGLIDFATWSASIAGVRPNPQNLEQLALVPAPRLLRLALAALLLPELEKAGQYGQTSVKAEWYLGRQPATEQQPEVGRLHQVDEDDLPSPLAGEGQEEGDYDDVLCARCGCTPVVACTDHDERPSEWLQHLDGRYFCQPCARAEYPDEYAAADKWTPDRDVDEEIAERALDSIEGATEREELQV